MKNQEGEDFSVYFSFEQYFSSIANLIVDLYFAAFENNLLVINIIIKFSS